MFKKIITSICLIAVVALLGWGYFHFYFVWGEGVRSGELNYVVYKGILWKTYEGKLIQSGIRSQEGGSVQSNTFEFSVKDEELARRLMTESGAIMQLHYKEYYGKLPWRGHTRYIVDSVVSIRPKIETTLEESVTNLQELQL